MILVKNYISKIEIFLTVSCIIPLKCNIIEPYHTFKFHHSFRCHPCITIWYLLHFKLFYLLVTSNFFQVLNAQLHLIFRFILWLQFSKRWWDNSQWCNNISICIRSGTIRWPFYQSTLPQRRYVRLKMNVGANNRSPSMYIYWRIIK